MAVVTHGLTLPDSSQKTDFYAIIDNATVTSIQGTDLSASANIQDSQLNTISTAGKVNTSALTGQIANANIAQITTAALVSGAALTLLPNIPSGAGVIPSANIGALAGNPVTKTVTTIYQAATDGFITAANANGTFITNLYSDSSATPSTLVSTSNEATNCISTVSAYIKKNNYYQVTITGGSLAFYTFTSIGS